MPNRCKTHRDTHTHFHFDLHTQNQQPHYYCEGLWISLASRLARKPGSREHGKLVPQRSYSISLLTFPAPLLKESLARDTNNGVGSVGSSIIACNTLLPSPARRWYCHEAALPRFRHVPSLEVNLRRREARTSQRPNKTRKERRGAARKGASHSLNKEGTTRTPPAAIP